MSSYLINMNPIRFLLARFHMDALEKETTARRLMTKLENLPSKINDIYDSLFSRIANEVLRQHLKDF